MGLFSKKAYANLDEIVEFRKQLDNFENMCADGFLKLIKSVKEIHEAALRRTQSAERTAKKYEDLYAAIKRLEAEKSRSISLMKSELSRIPSMLEKEYVDNEGNKTVKRIPNPEYEDLNLRIQNAYMTLNSISDLAYRVNNDLSYTSRIARELYESTNQIKDAIPEIESYTKKILEKADSASYSLRRDIEALKSYLDFSFSI